MKICISLYDLFHLLLHADQVTLCFSSIALQSTLSAIVQFPWLPQEHVGIYITVSIKILPENTVLHRIPVFDPDMLEIIVKQVTFCSWIQSPMICLCFLNLSQNWSKMDV